MASIALTLNTNAAATLIAAAHSGTESVAIAGPIANTVWRSLLSRPTASRISNPPGPPLAARFFM